MRPLRNKFPECYLWMWGHCLSSSDNRNIEDNFRIILLCDIVEVVTAAWIDDRGHYESNVVGVSAKDRPRAWLLLGYYPECSNGTSFYRHSHSQCKRERNLSQIMTWGPLSVFVKKTMSIEIVIICSEMHFAMLTPSRVGGGEHPNLHWALCVAHCNAHRFCATAYWVYNIVASDAIFFFEIKEIFLKFASSLQRPLFWPGGGEDREDELVRSMDEEWDEKTGKTFLLSCLYGW